jgi:hypothetical protein
VRAVTRRLDGLAIRKSLGRETWGTPEPYGFTGWLIRHRREHGQMLISVRTDLEVPWLHASVAFAERMPTYGELALMHRAVFGDQHAYQVFAPNDQHVSFHEYALHLWGRLDGQPVLPEFAVQITPDQKML